jgi:hypothetical protein
MNKIVVAVAVALGLSLGAVQPAMAVTSTSTSKCEQAKASIAKLQALAGNSPEPYATAYRNMAKSQEAALAYYCRG